MSPPSQPPAVRLWLLRLALLGAAVLTLLTLRQPGGHLATTLAQAAYGLHGERVPTSYDQLDPKLQEASAGGNLYLLLAWPPEAQESLASVATTHWFRGTYVLYPRQVWLSMTPWARSSLDDLPVNAPPPDRAWLYQHQVGGVLALGWDGQQPPAAAGHQIAYLAAD